MRIPLRKLASAALIPALSSCSNLVLPEEGFSSPPPANSPDMSVLRSDPPAPAPCTRILAEAVASPDSDVVLRVKGEAALAGAYLKIPAGAVTVPTRIKLALGESTDLPPEPTTLRRRLSPSLCVLTDQPGLQLARKPLLVLPYTPRPGVTEYDLKMGTVRRGSPPELMPGLLVLDEENQLAGAEIEASGEYALIGRGQWDNPSKKPKVDILFVIDNSSSMTPKQKQLAELFPAFFTKITDSAVMQRCIDYHIAVVSTDMGNANGKLGDDAMLQSTLCTKRGLTGEALAACKAVCKDTELLDKDISDILDGRSYIKWSAPPAGCDPAKNECQMKQTEKIEKHRKLFQCLAFLGDQGSFVESSLGAVERFLTREQEARKKAYDAMMNPDPDKMKNLFFRSDANTLLTFVTDEDDCTFEEDQLAGGPYTQRARFFTATPPARCNKNTEDDPGCHPVQNYRCLGVSMKCKQLHEGNGKKTNCQERISPLMRDTRKSAEHLVSFLKDPISMGGLARAKASDSLLLRAVAPLWSMADMRPGFGARQLMSKLWEIDYWRVSESSPPESEGGQAFCQGGDDGQQEGHPELRINNVFEHIALLLQAEMPMACDPMKASCVTATKIESVCETSAQQKKLYDGIAYALLHQQDMVCRDALKSPDMP